MLTDTMLRNIKPGDKLAEFWDSRVPGLCLRISPGGTKSWTLRYRPKGAASQRRASLGRYPETSLAAARKLAEGLRADVAAGADPQGERKAAQEEDRAALTFDELAAEYIERYARRHKKSWQFDDLYLRVHVRPVLGARKAKTVTRADCAALLDTLARSSPVTANRVHSCLSKLFNWAIETGLVGVNPIAGLKKRGREVPKDRILSPEEIRLLWFAFGEGSVGGALRIILLTGLRPGEAAGITFAELNDLDLPDRSRIEISAMRMKGGKGHIVPLAPLTLAIMRGSLDRAHDGQTHAFPSTIERRGSIARHSLSHWMKRAICRLDPDGADKDTIDRLKAAPPSPHDLRRTVASGLAALGVPREDRLAILSHTIGDVHGRVYDRHDRLDEKRRALALWERRITEIVEPRDGAN
jgi:integrase